MSVLCRSMLAYYLPFDMRLYARMRYDGSPIHDILPHPDFVHESLDWLPNLFASPNAAVTLNDRNTKNRHTRIRWRIGRRYRSLTLRYIQTHMQDVRRTRSFTVYSIYMYVPKPWRRLTGLDFHVTLVRSLLTPLPATPTPIHSQGESGRRR